MSWRITYVAYFLFLAHRLLEPVVGRQWSHPQRAETRRPAFPRHSSTSKPLSPVSRPRPQNHYLQYHGIIRWRPMKMKFPASTCQSRQSVDDNRPRPKRCTATILPYHRRRSGRVFSVRSGGVGWRAGLLLSGGHTLSVVGCGGVLWFDRRPLVVGVVGPYPCGFGCARCAVL